MGKTGKTGTKLSMLLSCGNVEQRNIGQLLGYVVLVQHCPGRHLPIAIRVGRVCEKSTVTKGLIVRLATPWFIRLLYTAPKQKEICDQTEEIIGVCRFNVRIANANVFRNAGETPPSISTPCRLQSKA